MIFDIFVWSSQGLHGDLVANDYSIGGESSPSLFCHLRRLMLAACCCLLLLAAACCCLLLLAAACCCLFVDILCVLLVFDGVSMCFYKCTPTAVFDSRLHSQESLQTMEELHMKVPFETACNFKSTTPTNLLFQHETAWTIYDLHFLLFSHETSKIT